VFGPDGGLAEWIGICEPLGVGAGLQAGPRKTSPRPHVSAESESHLISGAQVRAARAIVNWSVRDLAEASGVSSSTIRRIEEDAGVPETRDTRKLGVIRKTLEDAGVDFLPAAEGKGGVRPA
jgi:predicted transcriptional regulator